MTPRVILTAGYEMDRDLHVRARYVYYMDALARVPHRAGSTPVRNTCSGQYSDEPDEGLRSHRQTSHRQSH